MEEKQEARNHFWVRVPGMLNLREVRFTETHIKIEILWKTGNDFANTEYFDSAQETLLDCVKPNARVEDKWVVVENSLNRIPIGQRDAETMFADLGWSFIPLEIAEIRLIEKGRM